MKVSFYFLSRLGLWARSFARRGVKSAMLLGAAIAFFFSATHEMVYHTLLNQVPGWVNSLSTVISASIGGALTMWLAMLAYRHMARQQDDEVAARQQLNHELTEERNLLRSMMEGTRDHIYFKDTESRFLRINEAMARSFGFKSAADAVGKSDRDLFDERQAQSRIADEKNVISTGEPILSREEFDGVRNGQELWVSSSKMPLRDRRGKIVGTFGISRDVSLFKQTEQRQRSITEGLQKILASTDELIACDDEDLLLRRAVELARANLGFERTAIFITDGDGVRGTYGTDLRGATTDERSQFLPRDGLWSDRLRLRAGGEKRWSVSDETLHELRGGSLVGVGTGPVATTPIQSSQHEVIGVFCNDNAISRKPLDPARQEVLAVYCSLLGNIVARKRAEREQRQAANLQRATLERTDRLNTVGILAAGMAHEINNPLQGILSHVRALQPYVPPDSGAVRNLEMVQKAIDTISALVRRLLVLGANEDRDGDGADACEVLEFVVQLLASQFQKSNVRVERKRTQSQLIVAMPRAELIQVMTNLLINARDAMPDGGVATIDLAASDDTAQITVSDTGRGIPKEIMERIFAPFFTTKGSKGTGLGLSVTESLVRGRKGTIRVESPPESGACFIVTLPLFHGDLK